METTLIYFCLESGDRQTQYEKFQFEMKLKMSTFWDCKKYGSIDRVWLKPYIKLQVNNFSFYKLVPHNIAGNFNRAKVPSFLKGKLGRVQKTNIHTLSEQNSMGKGKEWNKHLFQPPMFFCLLIGRLDLE